MSEEAAPEVAETVAAPTTPAVTITDTDIGQIIALMQIGVKSLQGEAFDRAMVMYANLRMKLASASAR